MKFNWGTGLMIGMALFVSFILFLVITMSTDKKYHYDLVTEEYYQKEMAYQTEIDAEENSKVFSEAIRGEKTKEGWLLTFPTEVDASKVTGTVFLYRPSQLVLDFQLPLVLQDNQIIIPHQQLVEGRWNITIEWRYKDTPYLYKEKIVY